MVKIIFWCEFPETIDWNKAKKIIDFPTKIYVTCKDIKDYKKYSAKVKSSNIELGVWPILDKKAGYWFSGYTKKEDIDKLNQFNGIDMKIDIEPPIPKNNYGFFQMLKWPFFYSIFNKPKNNEYLKKVIIGLSHKTKIILSGFPFPNFILRYYGDNIKLRKNLSKNYMFYTSFFPKIIKPFYLFYLKKFAKKKLKKHKNKLHLTIGLLGPGIFGNEPYFKDISEFKKAIKIIKNISIENIVIFRLGALLNKKDSKKWIYEIKKLL